MPIQINTRGEMKDKYLWSSYSVNLHVYLKNYKSEFKDEGTGPQSG